MMRLLLIQRFVMNKLASSLWVRAFLVGVSSALVYAITIRSGAFLGSLQVGCLALFWYNIGNIVQLEKQRLKEADRFRRTLDRLLVSEGISYDEFIDRGQRGLLEGSPLFFYQQVLLLEEMGQN